MSKPNEIEVVTSVQRRRRWTASEKAVVVQETYQAGVSVSEIARRHGVSPSQLFQWRKRMAEGGLSAIGADEPVVPASEYKALQQQVRELQRLLGKKTVETEILKEAIELAQSKKLLLQSPLPKEGDSK